MPPCPLVQTPTVLGLKYWKGGPPVLVGVPAQLTLLYSLTVAAEPLVLPHCRAMLLPPPVGWQPEGPEYCRMAAPVQPAPWKVLVRA